MELSDHDRDPVRALNASFDAWRDRHRAGLITLRTVASFALLLGAPAHATYPLASAKAVQGWCGPACVTMPGYDIVAALAFGALIVLLATAYAVLTATAYRALRRTRLRRAGVKEFAGLGLIYLAMVIIQLDPVLSGHRSNFFPGQLPFRVFLGMRACSCLVCRRPGRAGVHLDEARARAGHQPSLMCYSEPRQLKP